MEAVLPAQPQSNNHGSLLGRRKAGVLKYLMQHHDLSSLRLRGASAGALIVALAACEVDIDRAVERAHELAVEYGVYRRYSGGRCNQLCTKCNSTTGTGCFRLLSCT